MDLRHVQVTRYVTPLREGGSLPGPPRSPARPRRLGVGADPFHYVVLRVVPDLEREEARRAARSAVRTPRRRRT